MKTSQKPYELEETSAEIGEKMTLVYQVMLSDNLSFTANPEHGDIEFFDQVKPEGGFSLNVRLPDGRSVMIEETTRFYIC